MSRTHYFVFTGGDLLRLAMMFKPVTFYRNDVIAKQGSMPEEVTFLLSGAAVMTTVAKDPDTGRKMSVDVSQVTVGTTIEPVGVQIIDVDSAQEYRYTLTATTTCQAFTVGRNIAKRVLSKRHVLLALRTHNTTIDELIKQRTAQAKAGEAVRANLGFTPRKQTPRMLKKAAGSRRMPNSSEKRPVMKAPPPPDKDFRRPSVYVPEAKDQLADEQRKMMAMANYARQHPHREPLHHARNPRSLPGPMLRDRSVVAFGQSIRKPGIAKHEGEELLWHLPDENVPAGATAASMQPPSEAAVAASRAVSTSARLASAASWATAATTAVPGEDQVLGTPRGVLGPDRDLPEEKKGKQAVLKPMPPPRLLGGASRSRGTVVLGGLGIQPPGSARAVQPPPPARRVGPPSAAAQMLAQRDRANFQGRPVSLSRAGQGFEMKNPVPIIMDPAGNRGRGKHGTPRGGDRLRMGVSARGPHAVRAQSRASTAVTSSAG